MSNSGRRRWSGCTAACSTRRSSRSQLTEKLVAEWPGALAWLVEGYRDWREGGMRTPPQVLLATQKYQNEQDPLADYICDRCVCAPKVRVGRGDLFADYLSWSQQTGEKFPLGRTALFERVRTLPDVREDQWRVSGDTVPVRGFRGIGLAFSESVAERGV